MKIKGFISLLLFIFIVFSLLPTTTASMAEDIISSMSESVAAEYATATTSGTCGSYAKWNFNSETGTLGISGRGAMTDYESASKAPWASIRENIKTVIISDEVDSVGDYAFSLCNKMTSLVLSTNVRLINAASFSFCTSLTSLVIPDSVTYLQPSAFRGCSGLTDITVDENNRFFYSEGNCIISKSSHMVTIGFNSSFFPADSTATSINSEAFNGCTGLTSLTIPSGITKLSGSAFYGCSGLTSLSVDSGNTVYRSEGNCIIEIASGKLVLGCNTSVIPDDGSIKEIGFGAFYGRGGLRSVTIPSSVTEISSYAFRDCVSLTSVVIPNSVSSIGTGTFSGCVMLVDATISDKLTVISEEAFKGCERLASITIPNSVKTISKNAFYGCNGMISVTIGRAVTTISTDAFRNCNRILEIYNLSALSISAKSAANGYVGYYAINVYTTSLGHTILAQNGDFIFACIDSGYYLVNYIGVEDEVCLPGSFSYKGQNIVSYNIYKNAFANNSVITSVEISDSVSSVGEHSFMDCKNLTSVVIPDSVRDIFAAAFYNCPSISSVYITDLAAWCSINFEIQNSNPLSYADKLFVNGVHTTEIIIPNGTAAISDYAFTGFTGISSVTIPDSVAAIGTKAFCDCISLASIAIPTGVTSIGAYAFRNCELLTSLTIPTSVSSIGAKAFGGCVSLTQINYNAVAVNDFSKSSGVFDSAGSSADGLSVVIGDSVESIPAYFLAYSDAYSRLTVTSITIGKSVVSIGDFAFYCCLELTTLNYNAASVNDFSSTNCVFSHTGKDDSGISVIFGDTVEAIPEYLFNSKSDDYYSPEISSIHFGSNVAKINPDSFMDNPYINQITVSDGNSVYHDESNCLIHTESRVLVLGCKSSIIPQTESVAAIGEYAFYGCYYLASAEIGDNINSIGLYAFSGCQTLSSVIIGSGVKNISSYCFYKCYDLNSVTLSDSVKSIHTYAFGYCSRLYSITLPDSLESIGDSAFSNTGLRSVVFPDRLKSIGEYAFSKCESLASVTLGESVISIGMNAFIDCTKLKYNDPDYNYVKYLGSKSNPYYAAMGLTDITATWCTVFASTKIIADYAFQQSKLSTVTVGNGVTNIGKGAFKYCNSLSSVSIGNSVTTIESDAFYRCNELTSVSIPDSVVTIGDSAFSDCTDITSVNFGSNVKSIGWYSFANCKSLSYLILPESVAYIGVGAFANCPIYNCQTYGNAKYFASRNNPYLALIKAENTSITSCDIHPNTKVIANEAFYDCTALTEITVPDGVISICNNAFTKCSSLAKATVPDSLVFVGFSAFSSCTSLQYNSFGNDMYLGNNENPYVVLIKAPDASSDFIIKAETNIIYDYAFLDCVSLSSITIPDNITSIGAYIFSGCDNLAAVYYSGTEAQWQEVSIDRRNSFLSLMKFKRKLTVKFIDMNGNELFESEEKILFSGDEYSVEVPNYPKHHPEQNEVSGLMPNFDREIVVTYSETKPSAPVAPTLDSKTNTTVTLVSADGYEYKCDGGEWQTSNAFAELDVNTEYSFYQRIAETDAAFASESSEALAVTTDKTKITGTVVISGTDNLAADITDVLPPSAELSYQWYRDGEAIQGATSLSYRVTAADVGKTLKFVLTGTGDYTGSLEATANIADWGKGDIDLSGGAPTISDALLLFKHVAGVSLITDAVSLAVADLDGTSGVTIADALMLFKYVAGIILSV